MLLPDFGLDAVLVALHTFDSNDLLFPGEEMCRCRVVREKQIEEYEDDAGEE